MPANTCLLIALVGRYLNRVIIIETIRALRASLG